MNARDAASGYRTGPESPCARCGAPGDRASFFHAAEGLVCESCHRAEKVAEKARDNVREGRFMTASLGSLSAACALLSLSFVALHPAGIVTFGAFKLFAAAVAIPVVCKRAPAPRTRRRRAAEARGSRSRSRAPPSPCSPSACSR